MQTVFHHTRREHAESVLASVEDLLADDSTAVDRVAVVANANAVYTLASNARQSEHVAELAEAGVRFVACGTSLQQRDLDESALAEGVETVPVGVGELTRLQDDGYAYVKD